MGFYGITITANALIIVGSSSTIEFIFQPLMAPHIKYAMPLEISECFRSDKIANEERPHL